MTLRVPEDLAALTELADDYGTLPAVIVKEPGPDEEWDGVELPVLRAELYAELEYVGLHTAVPVVGPSPPGALTFDQALRAVTALVGARSLELFWVSGLRPPGRSETDLRTGGYGVRLALPLRAVAIGGEPPKVVFLAQTNGVSGARTA